MKPSTVKHILDSHGRRGQSLVEFAIILPVLLLLVIGIIEFGRAFYFKNQAINAAREAARLAVVTVGLDNTKKGSVESTIGTQFNATVVIGPLIHSPSQNGDPITATAIKHFKTIVPNFIYPFKNISSIVGTATMRYEQ